MGFLPGHTLVKTKGTTISQDTRCASVGNSFHTGVVASILRCCLKRFLPQHKFPTQEELARNFHKELSLAQAEVFTWCGDKPALEDEETWLDRLEMQSEAIPKGMMPTELQRVLRILSQCSYRGTDVHLDTLTFYLTGCRWLPLMPVSGLGKLSRHGPGRTPITSTSWRWSRCIIPSVIQQKA